MKNEDDIKNNILTQLCDEDIAKLKHDIKNSLSIILMRSELISLQTARTRVDIQAILVSTAAIASEVKVMCNILDREHNTENHIK